MSVVVVVGCLVIILKRPIRRQRTIRLVEVVVTDVLARCETTGLAVRRYW